MFVRVSARFLNPSPGLQTSGRCMDVGASVVVVFMSCVEYEIFSGLLYAFIVNTLWDLFLGLFIVCSL